MLAIDVIKLAQTGWASPIVFIPKNTAPSAWRLLSEVNPVKIWFSYHIPHVHEFIELVFDATMFSKLNAKVDTAMSNR